MRIIPAREHVSTGVFLRNRARAGFRARILPMHNISLQFNVVMTRL